MIQQIGHYEVLRELGRGGMGEVFLARDEILERQVAIKTVRDGFLADPMAKARFLREARAVAALSHPNIAAVFEAGETEDGPYLVMEFVEGETLTELRRRHSPSAERLIDIAKQLARALAHAHARNILHRDIKSSNAMFTTEGVVKLLDFGLAQMGGGEGQTTFTAPGSFVGTVHYGAPEVLSGGESSVQSDLYSLGVLLYAVACGRLPFQELGGAALIGAILHGDPEPPSHWNPELPRGIDGLIQRAMARSASDRFEHAAALLEELLALAEETPQPDPAPREEPGDAVAVLRFENLASDEELDWLGTGLAETIGVELGRHEGLRMIGRERIGPLLARESDPARLGRALGAHWVVAGAFQRAGDRLRITYRLTDSLNGEQLLQEKLDGAWDDVFALQDQLAESIVTALERGERRAPERAKEVSKSARLEAYELYARGLGAFAKLQKDSMEKGRELLSRAVTLDPGYAVAFATLGGIDSMRYIHRSDPDDLKRALRSLEEAVRLDPELAEPYPWLCYVHMRQGHAEKAIAAGIHAVELQPDLGRAHYFLGVTQLNHAEFGVDTYADAIGTLLDGTVADPEWSPTFLGLAEIGLRLGDYDRARQFTEQSQRLEQTDKAAQLVGKDKGRNRGLLQGSEMMLGWVAMREGDPDLATEQFRQSIQDARESDHVYREQFVTQSTLGLAELALRAGDHEKALSLYRRAWQMSGEFTTMLGGERLVVRALAGMAAAYAGRGEIRRAQELLEDAAQRYLELPPQNWFWGASLCQLNMDMCIAYTRSTDLAAAVAALEAATQIGWRDAGWLEADPELAPIREHPLHSARFAELVDEIRSRSEVSFEPAGRAIEGISI